MIWEYLSERDFRDAVKTAGGVCVVPIGCLEKHGPHAPLGTDTMIARQTCIRAAEKEPVVIFPTMYFGEKSGAGEFAGTVIFSIETRWHIFRETCREIFRNGFKKILFVNGHGGNKDMLNLFSRGMLQEEPNALIFTCGAGVWGKESLLGIVNDRERYAYLTDEDRAAIRDFVEQDKKTGHACFGETARIYHYMPQTLRMDRVRDESGDSVHRFDEFKEHGITSPFSWMADYPNSYHGDNDYVLNERIARAVAECSVDALTERFRFLKNERISDEYHAEWLAKQ